MVGDREMKNLQQETIEMMERLDGFIFATPGRYGGGWIVAGSLVHHDDASDYLCDLTGGDMDYFDARDWLNKNSDIVFLEHQPDLTLALDMLYDQLNIKNKELVEMLGLNNIDKAANRLGVEL